MTVDAVAANLGGVALVVLPGLGLAELFAPLRQLPFLRRLGYSYLLGLLVLGGVLFAASHLFGVPLRRPAILVAVLVPAVLGLVARLRRTEARSHRQASRWQIAAALCIAAICLGPLTSALTAPLGDWDGRMTWSPLAAYLRHEGTVDASVLQEDHWWIIHPRYPPLLPLAQVAAQETFGAEEDDQFYRALYAGFLPALLLVIYDGARRAAGTRAAILTVLCVAVLPFLSYGAGGATSAYSDLPLAGFYSAALVLLLLERTRPSAGLAAGCLLAGAILTKNEGALLAMAALLLSSLRLLRRPAPYRWFACAAGPALAAFALLTSWRAAIPNRDDEDYFAVLHLSDLLHGAVARLPVIVPEILRWTFRWSSWLGFWLLFLVILIAGYRALRRPDARLLLLAGLVPAAVGWAAYAVSTRLEGLLGETWDRFLLQGMVPLAITFAIALK
ncbi:MAG TPA: glycosyltransferase family 39 protein, partial [Thermoanaerobaculia bacterium]|nr:glycosyltransferase family 39 protein [Thermoanaerobaculia bacterium]